MCFDDFHRRVKATHPDNFSNEGLKILYDYLEESMGEDWMFDIGEISRNYVEATFKNFAEYHKVKRNREAIKAEIEQHSFVIGFTSRNTVVYGNF